MMKVLPLAAAAAVQLASAEPTEFGRETPLRRRTQHARRAHRKLKGQDESYDPYLGLPEDQERRLEGHLGAPVASMSASMSMSMPASCEFCPGGLADPGFELPTGDGTTCGTAAAFATTLGVDDPFCATVKLAEGICCPTPVLPTLPAETTEPACQSIVEIAAGNEDFSTLVAAVTAAGLVDALSGEGPLTVFAPTNDAFAALPEGTVDALLADPEGALTEILTYHVVSGSVLSTDLETGDVETLNGDSVAVTVSDDGVMINDSNVVAADIVACNGVIHVIDAVLIPPEDPTTTAAPEATTEAPGIVEPTTPIEPPTTCSCAPLEYTFELDLTQSCEVDTLEGSPGIGLTFCFLGIANAADFQQRRARNLRQLKKERSAITFERNTQEAVSYTDVVNIRQNAADVEIVSVQFLEFDTTGELIVINQDDTYANVSLASGDMVSFQSIANDLDPEVPIEDQLDFLPGGVQVTMRGLVTVDGEELIVSNRVTWSYSNACDAEPIAVGDEIGWTTVSEMAPAGQAFCPVAPAPPTTPTPTLPPVSGAPVAAPVAPSTMPPVDVSMSMGKSGKAIFAKSSKGVKSSKGGLDAKAKTKKTNTKTAKTYGKSSKMSIPEIDTKSGKALVDVDAKAEKEASAEAGSKSGKMSKMGKAGSMPAMSVSSKAASAKSAKGPGYHLFPKSAKAHSMPPSMPGSSWGGSRQ